MEKRSSLQIVQSSRNYRDVLLAKAFRIVPGINYNEASYELREKNRDTSFQLYEVILEEDTTREHLRDEIFPSLVRYLKYKSIDPGIGKGVVISVFSRDRVYLIEYPEFMKGYCEIEGLHERGFHLRVRTWLSEVNP